MAEQDLQSQSPIKRALHEVREMRGRLDRMEQATHEPIAIVGLGCRFPGAGSPAEFWDLLRTGGDAIQEVPRERWNLDDYFDADPDAPGKIYARHGGFLGGIDRFDARFFGITPREAEAMDPQQRLLLEVTWEALEDAGIAADQLAGQKAGVFVGISTSDYMQLELRSIRAEAIDAYLASGGCQSVAAGRLSYFLGVQGPAVSIDTACSSSLVAIHLACQSLRSGESTMAIAAGVSLMLLPELTINFCRARMLAPDGRCKTFDKAADGYVRSEGCGVVVLKRLSDAVAAGDRVLALVRGSAVNQDGRSSGLTVPNGPAQEAVILEALRNAGLAPADLQYVEAHGTGTSLGDPIEVQALGHAFAAGRAADDPLLIGSVKTNIGHLEAAAGVAGLLKLVLSLRHGQIPAHLHFREPNPHVNWGALPVRVATELAPWSTRTGRRIGGLSSFGFSGTNAHVIVEEGPAFARMASFGAARQAASEAVGAASRPSPDAVPLDRPAHVLPLSARSAAALEQLAEAFADRIDAEPDAIADICHTAATGRSHFDHRAAVVASDSASMTAALRSIAAGEASPAVTRGTAGSPTVAFLFTGQGSQYTGMGRELYETEPVFRQTLDRCDALLLPEQRRSILPIIFEESGALLDQTVFTQPAIFAIEYSLFELWKSWGIHPTYVMGHSLGEDVAACAAGVYSLEDGLRVISARGRLMQALPQDGAMVAVFAAEAVVLDAITGFERDLAVAAINGPENVALSGTKAALEQVVATLHASGVKTRPMVASHAFHSPLMDPILAPFTDITRSVQYSEPMYGFVSSVTGSLVADGEVTNGDYWSRHVRVPVRFVDAIRTLLDRGCTTFVEIGPAPTLVSLGRRIAADGVGAWLPSLRKGRPDSEQMGSTLAALYTSGARPDWQARDAERGRARVALPTYPFQRERHWSAAITSGPRTEAIERSEAMSGAWTAANVAAGDQAERSPFDLSVSSYQDKWQSLERLTTAYMVRALRTFGAFAEPGALASVETLLDRHDILAEYRTLLARWLGKLSDEGFLERAGDHFRAPVALPDVDLDAALDAARRAFGDDRALLDYVTHCGGQLVDVLTGAESPLETLFPGGSSHLASALYETGPVARYFNGIARAAVAAAAGHLTSGTCRVIEIGAGTGGTSAAVIPALPAATVSYTFTDVGGLFLLKARERFSAYPFVEYAQLDAERDPADQGFEAGTYDVVIAANVLHATRNLHTTADRALGLLGPGGILVLLETTRHPSWFDISTGLIHGWQIFEDELRGDHPLLGAGEWEQVLRAHGAASVESYPPAGSPAGILGQHVIVARGPLTSTASAPAGHRARRTAPAVAVTATAVPTVRFADRIAGVTPEESHDLLVELVRATVAQVPGRGPRKRREKSMNCSARSSPRHRSAPSPGCSRFTCGRMRIGRSRSPTRCSPSFPTTRSGRCSRPTRRRCAISTGNSRRARPPRRWRRSIESPSRATAPIAVRSISPRPVPGWRWAKKTRPTRSCSRSWRRNPPTRRTRPSRSTANSSARTSPSISPSPTRPRPSPPCLSRS